MTLGRGSDESLARIWHSWKWAKPNVGDDLLRVVWAIRHCPADAARAYVCEHESRRSKVPGPPSTSGPMTYLRSPIQSLSSYAVHAPPHPGQGRSAQGRSLSPRWFAAGRRRLVVLSALASLLILASVVAAGFATSPAAAPRLAVPSVAGLNYGFPRTVSGQWVGTQWLRSQYWDTTKPALAADLDFIQQHNLGRVLRIFVGLDQTIVWSAKQGFDGFDEPALQHFGQALDMFDARGLKAIVVLYDQEVVGSSGNFHFEALDGNHPIMRRNYLIATGEFLRRFGMRQTVIGWDLFNEAYNSLGPDGGLPKPPHQDPVSPNYSDQVVHDWLRDLYQTAKRAAPTAQFTASDTTELYWNPDPDLTKYQDVVDFYDIHIYDDNPRYPDWKSILHKPYIVGEAGASTANGHLDDQALNSKAVDYLLRNAQAAGVSAVLVQGAVFTATRDSLTPTGTVLAQFVSLGSPQAATMGWDPGAAVRAGLVAAARRIRRLVPG